ncbi:MAG: 16S rRNA (cytosine(1402)-N(4))-methyltransferase RsmH [Pirellulales bacterium]|nr:16S rRNA (cytosine(1402)-N(4))-methyltransferase RsmH [Pirellulales bacterium]
MNILDGTLGGAGHARALAEAINAENKGNAGLLIGLDRDPAAITRAEKSLAGLPVVLAESNYADAPEVLAELDLGTEESRAVLDGVLLDLGLSSDQLADEERGFSFHSHGPLDLRFDPTQGEPAWRLINQLRPENLADLIYRYGEERLSRRIARAIESERRKKTLESAADVADVIRRAVPASARYGRIHPATRTFQALRIAVNDELKWLEVSLRRFPELLKPGGKLAIISFHSLEDRLVKQAFRDDNRLEVITRSPIRPCEAETETNPRSRSAKLRVAERIATTRA